MAGGWNHLVASSLACLGLVTERLGSAGTVDQGVYVQLLHVPGGSLQHDGLRIVRLPPRQLRPPGASVSVKMVETA